MTGQSYDFIIVGGGLTGAALSYYLSQQENRVLLLEARNLCGGSSGACAGRAQIFECESEAYLDVVLAGFSKLERLGEELGCDLEWVTPGHLSLIQEEKDWETCSRKVSWLKRRNIPAEMLDQGQLRKEVPILQSESFLGAAYAHEGHVNPFNLCMGYIQAARRQGARVMAFTPVIGFQTVSGRITGVRTPEGIYSGAQVVVSGGAWSRDLLLLAGFDLPLRFTHAEAMITEKLPPVLSRHVGMTGFYETVHGGNQSVTLGLGQHPNGSVLISNAIQSATVIDQDSTFWGMPALAKALKRYFPIFGKVRIMRTWAAPSPFLPDYYPAIGWVPGADNLFIAAGFHLAVPTIPVLCADIAKSMMVGEPVERIVPYSPGRFVTKIREEAE